MTDPRQHRHVRTVEADRITYRCGCVNEVTTPHGLLRCLVKCKGHQAEYRPVERLDRAYYEELGARSPEAPDRYLSELVEALGPFPEAGAVDTALEVGCGTSPYVPAIRAAGWHYMGMDASAWAVEWMRGQYGKWSTFQGRIEDIEPDGQCGLILAAHCLEHVQDMPWAIRLLASLLYRGGELWIVIPDDSDPVNPDHLWFANPVSLRSCVESAGLAVERLVVRRYIQRESFLYLRARKP